MSIEHGTVTGHLALLDAFRKFITGVGTHTTPAPGGTNIGDGTMTVDTVYPGSPTETWTINCTDVTTVGAEVWSVTGSVSGVKASATTGVAYDNGIVGFTITAGVTNWALSDDWTFDVTQGAITTDGHAWTERRWTDTAGGPYELWVTGPGLDGLQAITTGFETYKDDTAGIHNWRMRVAAGFLASANFDGQPGTSAERAVLLWNQPIEYWFVANGQRWIVISKVSTVWEVTYGGYIYPYALPGQYPYPIVLSACWNSGSLERFSSLSGNHYFGFKGGTNLALRLADGTYTYGLGTWPFQTISNPRPSDAGEYGLLPIVISDASNTYGEFDGVFQISGYNNGSENTVTIATVDYLVVQSTYHTGTNDYVAIKLA